MPDPIYKFNGLKALLTEMGYQIEEANQYRPLKSPVDVVELDSFRFSDDGIFYVDETGQERQVYLYKRRYHINRYGKPRYHICYCETIQRFTHYQRVNAEYRASNMTDVPVYNMDDNEREVIENNLPLCRYCKRLMGEGGDLKSNQFVDLLRDIEANQEVDLFGYTRDWAQVCRDLKEECNFTCQQCGIRIENMADRYYLQVHHMNGNKADNRPANLRCLCIRCHSRVDDSHRETFSRGANLVALDDFNDKYPEPI